MDPGQELGRHRPPPGGGDHDQVGGGWQLLIVDRLPLGQPHHLIVSAGCAEAVDIEAVLLVAQFWLANPNPVVAEFGVALGKSAT